MAAGTVTSWLLADVELVPMDGPPTAPLGAVRRGALRIDGDRIVALGDLAPLPGERIVHGAGATVTPGFVQGHVHCTQTLFRGLADDLPLLPWLHDRIWPLEHAHDAESTRVSAELTFAELLATGTTTVQTMESVRHAEVAAEVAAHSGLTVITGNCLMDVASPQMPAGMATSAAEALQRVDALRTSFHGPTIGRGRVQIAVSPRFLLSCSDGLARDAAAYAAQHGLRVHTHAAEHPAEVAAVRARFCRDYVEVLSDQGLLGPRTGLAHCVHTSRRERDLLVSTGTAVLHCPTTNLKLGSGLAPIVDYRARGLRVAFGADGAPCNNRLSMPTELRQAALIACTEAGPGAFPAAQVLWTACRGGAMALGLDDVGALAPGLRADLVLWDLSDPLLGGDVASKLVYGASDRHLRAVICGGREVVRHGEPRSLDHAGLAARAAAARDALLHRAGLAR